MTTAHKYLSKEMRNGLSQPEGHREFGNLPSTEEVEKTVEEAADSVEKTIGNSEGNPEGKSPAEHIDDIEEDGTLPWENDLEEEPEETVDELVEDEPSWTDVEDIELPF